jgi:hypothetical protein
MVIFAGPGFFAKFAKFARFGYQDHRVAQPGRCAQEPRRGTQTNTFTLSMQPRQERLRR